MKTIQEILKAKGITELPDLINEFLKSKGIKSYVE